MGTRNGKGNSRRHHEWTSGSGVHNVGEALDRYERAVTPRKKSAADEPYKLWNWKESSLKTRTLASIHGKHVAEWRDKEIDRGSAPATVRRKLALLSHI